MLEDLYIIGIFYLFIAVPALLIGMAERMGIDVYASSYRRF